MVGKTLGHYDPSLRWVRFDDGIYVPFSPPAIGARVSLAATRSPLEAQDQEVIDNYRKALRRTQGR